MNLSQSIKCMSLGIVMAGASFIWATDQTGTKCSDLVKVQIDNATISEAVDIPAGKPFTVGGGFTPAVQVTSLPAHCLVHGEVNHHKGADDKDIIDSYDMS